MTISRPLRLTCLMTLLIVKPLYAQEETTTGSEPEVSGTESAAIDDPAEPKEPEAEKNEQQPQAENLKNRDLGAAFESFQPSEEISADNAVPFPIDI